MGAIKCRRGKFCNATIDHAHVARRGKNTTIMTVPMAQETQTTPPFWPRFHAWSGLLTSGAVDRAVTPPTGQ
jgi:hypothetical protein